MEGSGGLTAPTCGSPSHSLSTAARAIVEGACAALDAGDLAEARRLLAELLEGEPP